MVHWVKMTLASEWRDMLNKLRVTSLLVALMLASWAMAQATTDAPLPKPTEPTQQSAPASVPVATETPRQNDPKDERGNPEITSQIPVGEPTQADSDMANREQAAAVLQYEPTEQISEDLSVSFPVDI